MSSSASSAASGSASSRSSGTSSHIPNVVTIAGVDPSGGAGVFADLKTFSALGVYGAAALAGLTVQSTQGVRAAVPVDPSFVRDQVVAVIDDLPVAATKLGMLSNAEVAGVVADLLEERRDDFGVVDGLAAQATALVAAGARAALVKGGHMAGDELTDAFADASGVWSGTDSSRTMLSSLSTYTRLTVTKARLRQS